MSPEESFEIHIKQYNRGGDLKEKKYEGPSNNLPRSLEKLKRTLKFPTKTTFNSNAVKEIHEYREIITGVPPITEKEFKNLKQEFERNITEKTTRVDPDHLYVDRCKKQRIVIAVYEEGKKPEKAFLSKVREATTKLQQRISKLSESYQAPLAAAPR